MPFTFTSGQILTAADLNNVFAQTSTTATNASTLATGTVVETVLPFRMNQNVTTTSNVTFANVTITGNLTVSGTTTSINTSNLDITDLNITVGKGSTSNALANGAGITVDFANAQMFYLNPANTWAFNRDLTPYTGNAFSLGNTTARWVIQANTINASGLITGTSGADITGIANASSAMYVGANSYMNLISHFVGNSTVNTDIRAGVVTVNGAFIANNSGVYHSGIVNALTIQASATFTANATLVNAAAINITGQVNTVTLYATTSANIASAVQANSTGIWTTGTVNGATISATATFTANATLVNAAAINISNQANVATLYAGTSANIASITLANASGLFVSNTVNATAFTTANSVVNTTQISIGTVNSTTTGVVSNTTVILIGNSTVNATVNSTIFSGTSLSANNSAYLGGVAAANYVANSGDYTISGVHTHTANIVMSGAGAKIIANGGFGSVNYVLSSNGTGMYWADLTVSSVNTLAVYTFTNNHTFGNTSQQANVIMANGYILASTINATSITTTSVTINTIAVAVGANVTANATTMFVGNSSVNTVITANQITLNGANVMTTATTLKVYYANNSQAFP